MSLYIKLRDYFLENNLKISTAESCTGGFISSLLTDIEGASGFLEECFVTYSENAKIKHLGVNPITIQKYGVVSEEVAKEMALGLLKYSDVGLSTTGLLGPAGDGVHPIGTVFIGMAAKDVVKVIEYHSKLTERTEIKKDFAQKALAELASTLNIS